MKKIKRVDIGHDLRDLYAKRSAKPGVVYTKDLNIIKRYLEGEDSRTQA